MSSSWFEITNSSQIEQGDIIENCNILVPNSKHYDSILQEEEVNTPIEIIVQDCIIMSQSCDIINSKIDFIVICPIIALKETSFTVGNIENLKKGRMEGYVLLNKNETNLLNQDYYVVDFRNIYSIPKDYIKKNLKDKNRLRLISPYKEYLSQSFAKYFMRIGLPVDINVDDLKQHLSP